MSLRRHVLGFLAVGGAATALQYALLVLFVEALDIAPVIASAASYASSALANYWANRRFTFQSDAAHRRALPRFVVVASLGLALNTFVMWLAHEQLALNYLLSQVIATGVTLVWNFILNRCWTFAPAQQ